MIMNKQKGIALVAALGIIIVVGIISAFVCRVAVISSKVANRGGMTLESQSNAESALNAGYMSLASRFSDLTNASKATGENVLADKPICSGNNRETCLWWQYDTDSAERSKSVKGEKFNGWISDAADASGSWHVFDLSKTLKSSDGKSSPFQEGQSVYRIEQTDNDFCPNGDGQSGNRWFRITARGMGYGGSRSYVQARVKVPVMCEGSIGVDKGVQDVEPAGKKVTNGS